MTLVWLLVQLAVCALLIGWAGYVLSGSADRLAVAYGWGKGWVGLALLATVTSLPELASGVSAVAFVDAPNLAVGNALGSCVLNLLFLVVVDALQREQPMYCQASSTHLLSASFGVVMLGFVALSLLMGTRAPAILHVGVYSPLLLALYLVALKGVHAHERQSMGATAAPRALAPHRQMRHEWGRFGLTAALVLAAGSWLPQVADDLAKALGVSRSFVGTVLMAVLTTLPEVAVTLGALRIGALDMAIGNLLGSNLFNIAILAMDDAFYVRGPLLADASAVHASTAATALVMTGLVIIGLVMRPKGRAMRVLGWVSAGLVASYAMNATLVYLSHP